ncbi:MAG TPA: hypothetical protein VEW03_08165, partial [Longimicrobiaceae bacterium]|nr:hypothetical protein [Longimicrobiaceae bacterium]
MPILVDPDKLLQCNLVDCRAPAPPDAGPEIPRQAQAVDYMARDYDSYLRALLDLLPSRVPGWRDRSEADLGMAILELFAFMGDQLSYYQDRVAAEGFLRTAVQYDSVRRLLRLVDYRLHPGTAARALLVAVVDGAGPRFLPAGFAVTSAGSTGSEGVGFETDEGRVLYPELNAVALAADAPADAAGTRVVLAAELDDAFLGPGSLVLLEEDPVPATPPRRREWGELASAPVVDTVANTTTLTLREPLAQPHPAAATRVRANTVRASHGRTHRQADTGTGLAGQALVLDYAPLTFTAGDDGAPLSSLRVGVDGDPWTEVEDFIDSAAADRHFRVARENDGGVTVLFGSGEHGEAPRAGAAIEAVYRSGVGEAGAVAADTLRRFDYPGGGVLSLSNPLPSFGMREPEGVDEARLRGPRQLRSQNRAVTPADYERALLDGVDVDGRSVRVLHARAHARWTGSWTTMVVSVDLAERGALTPGVRAAFEGALAARRLAGRDVRVEEARYAPLHLRLTVGVKPGAFARLVRQGVERALGGGGFFAPG